MRPHGDFWGDNLLWDGTILTGIDLQHPDLAANLWRNLSEIPDNNIDDDNNVWTAPTS